MSYHCLSLSSLFRKISPANLMPGRENPVVTPFVPGSMDLVVNITLSQFAHFSMT